MAKGLTVKEGRTELTAPNGTTFISPYVDRETYAQVMQEIGVAGLRRPTFKDTIVLAHAAWQEPEEKYSKQIIDLMRSDWLVADTGILYISEGAYIQDHPEMDKNGWPALTKEDLASKLEANDPNVRFTGYNYQNGEMSAEDLAENKFVQALVGDEEISKLVAEIANKYSDKPCLWAFTEAKEPITRVASLYSGRVGYWLCVGDGIHGSHRDCYALGVAPAEK